MKKLFAALLVLALLLSLPLCAQAAASPAIQRSVDGLLPPRAGAGGTVYDHVYLGIDPGTNAPIPWRVLDPDRLTQSMEAVLLLREAPLAGSTAFSAAGAQSYFNSDAYWLCQEALSRLSSLEQMGLIPIERSDPAYTLPPLGTFEACTDILYTDKLFLPSMEEVVASSGYFPGGAADRATGGGWWTRSATENEEVGYIDVSGQPATMSPTEQATLRPAAELAKGLVTFSSLPGAKAGKDGGLFPVPDDTGADWKLTMYNFSRSGFKARTGAVTGRTLEIVYKNANVGLHEYISAAITQNTGSGKVLTHYGRLCAPAAPDGVYRLTLPDGVTLDENTYLHVYSETYCGDAADAQGYTDYVGNYQNILAVPTVEVTAMANGSDTENTTALTLMLTAFGSATVPELTLADVELVGAAKDRLVKNADGVYTLYIKDITVADGEAVDVYISKTGYNFSPPEFPVTVRCHTPLPAQTLVLTLDNKAYPGRSVTLIDTNSATYPAPEGPAGTYTAAVPPGNYEIGLDGKTVGKLTVADQASTTRLNFFTVQFSANRAAQPPKAQIVLSGSFATQPQLTDIEPGWRLVGWYRNADFTKPWGFNSEKVSAPLTLYAKFSETAVKYTLTVTASPTEGGTVTPGGEILCDANQELTLLATPNKGWKFSHWMMINTGKSVNTASYTVTVTADMTIRAIFLPIKSGEPAKPVDPNASPESTAVSTPSLTQDRVSLVAVGSTPRLELPLEGTLPLRGLWYSLEGKFASSTPELVLDVALGKTQSNARDDLLKNYFSLYFGQPDNELEMEMGLLDAQLLLDPDTLDVTFREPAAASGSSGPFSAFYAPQRRFPAAMAPGSASGAPRAYGTGDIRFIGLADAHTLLFQAPALTKAGQTQRYACVTQDAAGQVRTYTYRLTAIAAAEVPDVPATGDSGAYWSAAQ